MWIIKIALLAAGIAVTALSGNPGVSDRPLNDASAVVQLKSAA